MSRLPSSAAQPRRAVAVCHVGLAGIAWLMCATFTTPHAHAGRTDSDWLAPAQHALQIDAPADLERLGMGQPAPASGSASGPAAIVADMRIATQAEARALLQGGSLPGGTDSGGGTATLSALLDRLSVSMPSSADLAAPGPAGAGAGLDCALFADGVRVRRLLGASDPHKPGESAGSTSAMGLDVPIRCLATVSRLAAPAPGKESIQPVSDPTREVSGGPFRPRIEDWVTANSTGLTALAGSTLVLVALVAFGLAARARIRLKGTMRGAARDMAREHRWP